MRVNLLLLAGTCLLLGACSGSPMMFSSQTQKIIDQTQFQPYHSSRPDHEQLINSFDQAMLQVSKLNYGLVVNLFYDLSQQFTQANDSQRASESAFWHAFCLEKMGKTDLAAQAYLHVIETWPHTKASQQAKQRQQMISNK